MVQPPLPPSLPPSEPQCNLRVGGLDGGRPRGAGPSPCARFLFMRCIYCQARAGILRKVCSACAVVIAVVEESAGQVGWTELIDIFVAKGLSKAAVDRVLDAEIEATPTLRDRLTSRMANELMRSLGMPGRQSPEDVRRVRLGLASSTHGSWSAGEKPPGHS
jgi:hypothetical protein